MMKQKKEIEGESNETPLMEKQERKRVQVDNSDESFFHGSRRRIEIDVHESIFGQSGCSKQLAITMRLTAWHNCSIRR